MRIRASGEDYLHEHLGRQTEMVFAGCPEWAFSHGLELGAGDGFQSVLLSRYVKHLISTDLNIDRLGKPDTARIEYRLCDAERVGESFAAGQFDLVFSSAMLEHLPDTSAALSGIQKVLRDDGVTIHVVPNRVWKLLHVLLYVPTIFVYAIEHVMEPGGVRAIRKRALVAAGRLPAEALQGGFDNNPKTGRGRRPMLLRCFVPEPHGVSQTNLAELRAFGRARWSAEFERAGFDVIAVIRGPLTSGYGFGLNKVRRALEWFGISSMSAVVAVKKGAQSRYADYFVRRGSGHGCRRQQGLEHDK